MRLSQLVPHQPVEGEGPSGGGFGFDLGAQPRVPSHDGERHARLVRALEAACAVADSVSMEEALAFVVEHTSSN